MSKPMTLEEKAIKADNKQNLDKHEIDAQILHKKQDKKNEDLQQRYRDRDMYLSPTDKNPNKSTYVNHSPSLNRTDRQRKFQDEIDHAAVNTEDGPIGFGGKTKKNKKSKKSKTTKKSKKNRKSNKKRKSKKSKH